MEVHIMTEKRCFKCSRVLPISEYYTHPDMSDGHLGKCKDCARADARETRRNRTDYYREYDRQRAKLRKRRDQTNATARRRHKAYPEKTAAHNAVTRAIRKGSLARPGQCSNCGVECKPNAHHDDYSKPLDVRWLCRRCHGILHGWYKECQA